MIALWLLTAWADPAAVRAPSGSAVEVGFPTFSVATPYQKVRIAGWGRWDGGAAGFAVARSFREGWLRVDVHGGVQALFTRPGLGLDAGGAIGVEGRGDTRVQGRLQLVVPAALRVTPTFDVRLPLLAEGAGHVRIGRVRVGARLASGLVVSRYRPSIALQGGVFVAGPLSR